MNTPSRTSSEPTGRGHSSARSSASTPTDGLREKLSPSSSSQEREAPKASQCLFPIEWDKIRYDRKPMPSIRYRQPHKRTINSRSQPSSIYRHVPTQASELGNEVRNSFHKWALQKKGVVQDQDEYTKYLLAPTLPEVTDARSWWLEPTQRKSYPALSTMTLDVLSIPAMSAEPERLFSGAKITITDRRNRMGIESIEASECLKSWLSKGGRVAFADDDLDASGELL
ncbi:hypothetical protein ACQRIU_006977 [Beauveria bassiana]